MNSQGKAFNSFFSEFLCEGIKNIFGNFYFRLNDGKKINYMEKKIRALFFFSLYPLYELNVDI